jgi:hypothetical protein
MVEEDARVKVVDNTVFWHMILPALVLIFLCFVLFVVYTMPDWAITCRPDLMTVRKLAASFNPSS